MATVSLDQATARLMKKLQKLGADADPIMECVIAREASRTRDRAVRLAPANHDELRQSIYYRTGRTGSEISGTVYTTKEYAAYVEFGTGPRGAANHSGVSPEVPVNYRPDGWWLHSSMISEADAERYHMYRYQAPNGEIFYRTEGAVAQPYLYPALHDNEDLVKREIRDLLTKELKGICHD